MSRRAPALSSPSAITLHSPRVGRPWCVATDRFVHRLFAPVDVASIVAFRIAFGLIMLWEVYRYVDHGWIAQYYVNPRFNFTYVGFEWVKPWPGSGMYLHFLGLGALALCIVVGLWYRVATALFFLGFTYVFLLEKAHYLNHFYFISLLSFALIFVPAHRALSFDAADHPERHTPTAPAWALWLLRAQLAIVYLFGGVAKLNGDWLRGEPMRSWLAFRTDFPLIGRWFTEEWMVYSICYGGLLFDLLIVPLLLWRRTRPFAFVAAILFHVMNDQLFAIGIFPWLALAATLLYFAPDYPRRLIGRLPPFAPRIDPRPTPRGDRIDHAPPAPATGLRPVQRAIVAFLAIFLGVQALIPLRHHVIPGDVAWTEEGHRFSWRMKLRDKRGEVRFFATNPVRGATWEVEPRHYLTSLQVRKMATQPDMILQFSHYLAEQFRADGHEAIEIRAQAVVSLNGRAPRPMIDPTVDLAAETHRITPQPWILPLTTPLTAGKKRSTPAIHPQPVANMHARRRQVRPRRRRV
ncbi:MAG: HTTM domain-containing protein [Thermomicrobiales bacterium]